MRAIAQQERESVAGKAYVFAIRAGHFLNGLNCWSYVFKPNRTGPARPGDKPYELEVILDGEPTVSTALRRLIIRHRATTRILCHDDRDSDRR
jgi:hypothetical protein